LAGTGALRLSASIAGSASVPTRRRPRSPAVRLRSLAPRACSRANGRERVHRNSQTAAEATARAAVLAEQLAWHLSLTQQADAAAAFLTLAGPLLGSTDATVLQQLSSEVVKLGEASEHGVTVYFRGGAEADWSGDMVTVYSRPTERDAERPCLEYAVTSGPPLGDEEVEGEVSGDVTWFLNEYIYSYWFFTSDEPLRARKWDHDGGIAPDPIVRSPVQVLGDLLLAFARLK
jgi:hypothetical protein